MCAAPAGSRTVRSVYIPRAARVAFLGTGALLAAGAITLVSLPWTVQLLVRDVPALSAATLSAPSTVLAGDGSVLATIRPVEQVTPLPAGPLPDAMVAAVVATEDRRFYNHHGVDPIGLARAVFRNLRNGGVVEGGSTITQQLVKNEVVGTTRSYERKIREALLALRVEQAITKEEILRRYLDVIYVGAGARGAETAARQWFGVGASQLTLGQAALVVAVLPSPNRYSPFSDPELAESRRQLVLDRVAAAGTASAADIERARDEAVLDALLPQTRDAVVDTSSPWVLDTVAAELRRLAPAVDLAAGGFVIHTGIDAALQADAEKAIVSALDAPGMPDGALVVLDASSGEVRAVVGGKDRSRSVVNVALGQLGGGSGRQGGSSLKPVTLAAALEQGWTLQDRIAGPASLNLPGRKPAWNYDRRNWGTPTLLTATAWSVNTAYLNLATSVGTDQVASVGRKLGLDLRGDSAEIAIGMDEVSPLTLAGAYAAFASDGVWRTPHTVRLVEQDGVELWRPVLESRQVLQRSTVDMIGEALAEVVTNGTGGRAAISGADVRGKTGTTDNHADAWFAGWAGELVAAVWVGHLEGLVPMTKVPGWGKISGGSLPALIWQRTLERSVRSALQQSDATEPVEDATDEQVPVIEVPPLPEPTPTGALPGDADAADPVPTPGAGSESPSPGPDPVGDDPSVGDTAEQANDGSSSAGAPTAGTVTSEKDSR